MWNEHEYSSFERELWSGKYRSLANHSNREDSMATTAAAMKRKEKADGYGRD